MIIIETEKKNIGINLFDRRFGDLTLQYDVNKQNCKLLYDYYQSCLERLSSGGGDDQSASSGGGCRYDLPLEMLVRQFSLHVESKKSKNTELLHLASEVRLLRLRQRLTVRGKEWVRGSSIVSWHLKRGLVARKAL